MRRFVEVVALVVGFFLLGGVASAQTPAPPVQHFVMSTATGSFHGDPVAIASTGIQITAGVSIAYEFVSNPNDSSKPRVGSGLANYTFQASRLVPAKLKSKLLIDLSNYNVTLQGGAGRESLSNGIGKPRSYRTVGNFGAYGSYPLPGGHTQIGLGYKFITGAAGGLIKVPTGTLNFTF